MSKELYARNIKSVSFQPPKIWTSIPQNIKYSSPLLCYKRVLENGYPNAHVIYAKHFFNMLVFYTGQQQSSFLSKNYSHIIYLEICFVF